MNRKDILELRRRLKKEECTFTKMCGCYVNSQREITFDFRETFLNLPDDVFYKYLEISKKVLSASVGNNMLELNFNQDDNFSSEKQASLIQLKKSGLKNDQMLHSFYQSIIDGYDFPGNYLILLFHDAYDVIVKTSDGIKMDDSEEVYEYVICAICPVTLSKPGLGYFQDEQKIDARIRDWVVSPPALGFVYPGFIDRSSDVNTVMYYAKNAKEPHPELMEQVLGCGPKQTATIQKETFSSIIKTTVSPDETISEQVFTDIQESLNTMVESHYEVYEDVEAPPMTLSKDKVKEILIDCGVSEEATSKIETSYEETFGEDLPLAENLVDTKVIKANAHKKKEDALMKQIEALEEAIKQMPEEADEGLSDDLVDAEGQEYDVVLQVKPDKLPTIKTETINGQRCLVVPLGDDEQATINGMKDLLKELTSN